MGLFDRFINKKRSGSDEPLKVPASYRTQSRFCASACLLSVFTLFAGCANNSKPVAQVPDSPPRTIAAAPDKLSAKSAQNQSIEFCGKQWPAHAIDVSCHDSSVADLTPLAALTELETLGLYETGATDLTPLATLTKLRKIVLVDTPVADIAPLATLTELELLHMHRLQVTDIAPLAALTRLESLSLEGLQVTDIAPLVTLTNLIGLILDGTQVTDITPLATLTKLKFLSLVGTPVMEAEVARLKNRIPALEVDVVGQPAFHYVPQ